MIFFRRFAALAALTLASGLAGCAAYRPRPIDAAATGHALLARRLTDPRLERFLAAMGHPAPRWDLATLTLVAAYERPDLTVARTGVSVALADGLTARALPNPTIGLAPTYNATTFVPSPWKIGPLVTFLIESYGARPARIAAASAQLRAARAKMLVAAWGERDAVRRALLALWDAEAQSRLAARTAGLADQAAQAIGQRYAAGMISAGTDNLANVAAQQQRFGAALAARRVTLARAGLAGAIGLPAAALRGIAIDVASLRHPPIPADLATLRETALATRPDIQASLADYAGAQDRLRLAIARQYPSLALGPGYQYDQGDNKFSLSLSLPLPIFNQNQGPIAAARAGRRQAAAQFDLTQQAALAQIDTAIADLRASERTVAAARAAMRGAIAQSRYARQSFAAGAIGRIRLIGAEQARAAADADLLTARMQRRTAIGHVEAALYHPIFGAGPS